ncbi:uncharacterized [Tachysurus ichikawai]
MLSLCSSSSDGILRYPGVSLMHEDDAQLRVVSARAARQILTADRCFLSRSDLKLNTRPDVMPVAWPKLLRRAFHQSAAGGSAYKPHVCEREICDVQLSEGQLSLNPHSFV